MLDVIIIGAGTAGLTAAIYVQRAGKKALVLDAKSWGGQILNTADIENYPGIKHISGFEFASILYKQATDLGTEVMQAEVIALEDKITHKLVRTSERDYETKTVIIATGMKHRELGIAKEQEFVGKGVSYCATCDGAFFRGKEVVVNGGGNVAVEDAEFLSRFCRKVTIVHRRDQFRADETAVAKIRNKDNISLCLNSRINRLLGEKKLEAVEVIDNEGQITTLPTEGLFIAIGQIPMNQIFSDLIALDEGGFIIAKEDTLTNCPGIFAAGDCRSKEVRQLVTAAADGAVAALAACRFAD